MTFFSGYFSTIDKSLMENLSLIGPKSYLRDACEYSLTSGGKRLRPIITLMVAKGLGLGGDPLYSALGVEFYHTASLVADDLPSMDDDDMRRNKPSVHKKYGESTALLVSYALIAAGYQAIALNTQQLKRSNLPFANTAEKRCLLALENASLNTGLEGATGGQFMDLMPSDLSLPTLKQVIHQKTTSLFEIAFVYGWLFGGGDLQKLPLVKETASHFGLAFQIADDLGDMQQDIKNDRKVNVANVIGKEAALSMFHEELSSYLLKINDLGLPKDDFQHLADSITV